MSKGAWNIVYASAQSFLEGTQSSGLSEVSLECNRFPDEGAPQMFYLPQNFGTLAVTMPARNSSSAPKFDLKNLQDLLRYFAEVKLLLNALNVHDNQAKKDHTKHYLLVQDFEIWGAIPESSSFPLFSPFSPSLD